MSDPYKSQLEVAGREHRAPGSRFDGRRALVTGAGKGIGREIAALLVRSGADVVAVSRTPSDLETLQAQTGCRIIVADLSDPEAARDAALEAGPVDLLVNNAGISIPQSFLETTVDAFDQTMAVNVRAAHHDLRDD
jgi:L-xylulose reductase